MIMSLFGGGGGGGGGDFVFGVPLAHQAWYCGDNN